MNIARLTAAVVMTGSAVAVLGGAAIAGPPAVGQLSGTLQLKPGSCHHGKPSGSYLSVTFGTRAIKNSSSRCAGGAVTLLRPAQSGLLTSKYSSVAQSEFDHKALTLSTSSSSYFAPPRIYLVGNQVNADVRSVVVGYNNGQWPVGAERATGHYDASSHVLSLQWFSGQSFVPTSAGTSVHLEGHFDGTPRALAQGSTVNLGTASFDAGPSRVVAATPGSSTHRGHAGSSRRTHSHHHRHGRLAAELSITTGSPRTFLAAEVLVLLNLVTFVAVAIRRSAK